MFNNIKAAGTSNKNENVFTCDTTAVDVKIERESDDKVQQSKIDLYDYTYEVIKEEMAVGHEVLQHAVYSSNCPEEMYSESSAKTSEQIKNHKSNDHNGSIVKLETEAMSAVREEQTEKLYTDHEIKDEMVIGPVVLQAVTYMLEGNEMHSESSAKTSEPSQNHNSTDLNGSVIQLETEALSAVREEQTEDHEIKEIMVIGPDMLQAITHMLEKSGEPLPKKSRLDTQDENTDLNKTAKQTRTETNTEEMKPNENTKSSETEPMENVKNKIPTKTSKPRNNTQKNIRNDKNDKPTKNVFQCNVCAKQYDKIPDLVQHIESHDKTKREIYFKCKECTYQSVAQCSLERHLKLHDKSRRFVCDVCGYRYMNHTQLQQHLRYVHPGEKMHCEVCDYKTYNIYNLNRHLKKHSSEIGEKPYLCFQCEYKCNQKSYLKIHSLIHTGVKPYSCSECNYKCIQLSNLKRHLRTHSK